jgi:predicted transcriptional regulator
MPSNRDTQTISLYVPEKAQQQQVTQRLKKLGEKRDRSINYLVVEAILQYLDREEA